MFYYQNILGIEVKNILKKYNFFIKITYNIFIKIEIKVTQEDNI